MRRILTWTGRGVAVSLAVAAVALAVSFPAIAAVGCPRCYGFEATGGRLYVGAEMSAAMRGRLRDELADARRTVATALGPSEARPYVFACSTNACDRRIGGRGDAGARAQVQTTPWFSVVRLGPRGTDGTILAHELAHVTMHEIVGPLAVMDGRFPAWLNEGVAVIVSNDTRYLGAGRSADERCRVEPDGPLPADPYEWARTAGRDRRLYARAACAALHWLEANGGVEGLLDALRRGAATDGAIAAGRPGR